MLPMHAAYLSTEGQMSDGNILQHNAEVRSPVHEALTHLAHAKQEQHGSLS